jgi:hypothetical protein
MVGILKHSQLVVITDQQLKDMGVYKELKMM